LRLFGTAPIANIGAVFLYMSVKGWFSKKISSPRGAWTTVQEKREGNPSRASLAQNVRFYPGTVKTRPGTAILFTRPAVVNGMFNWIAPNGVNWTSYRQGTTIEALNDAGFTTLLNAIGATNRPSFADLDIWEYFCGADINGIGTFQASLFDGANVDKAFAPPIQLTNATITQDTTAGIVTVGNHYFGLVYQNRSGFLGQPTTNVQYTITATDNGTPDTLTAPGNTMADGDVIVIAGMMGDTAPNGAPRISYNNGVGGPGKFNVKDATSTPINGNGAYTGGGILKDALTFETTTTPAKIIITVTIPARLDGGSNAAGGQATLSLIATPVDNPSAWFFVPSATGASTTVNQLPVPYNTPVTLTFVYDTDDFTLQQGDSANNQFLILSQAADGTGPFFPNFVVAYGQRMCYGNGTTLYASDINAPQQIAPDRNAVTMPNQRYIGAAFPLPGGTDLFLMGEKWTAKVTDNSDIPATWSQPIKVSDALGAPFWNCVCAKTGGGYAWVATEGGVYLFDGVYQEKPLTYLCNDLWATVNWKAAYAIEIQDDSKNLKLYVAVPIGVSTVPNVIIVIDYQNCADSPIFDQVDISVDVYDRATFGGIGVIVESETGLTNLWIGPGVGGGSVVKLFPPYLNDNNNAVPIHWFWESGLVRLPQEVETALIRVGAMDVWAHGNSAVAGNPTVTPPIAPDLLISVFGPDRVKVANPLLKFSQGVPATLSTQPGISYMTKFDLAHVENFTVRFEGNALSCWMELSSFKPYYVRDWTNR
jgi:hypothetical protein